MISTINSSSVVASGIFMMIVVHVHGDGLPPQFKSQTNDNAVPAGHGKSRIIAGLIRLFSTKTSKSYKINVIYNDETLKTRD